MATALGDRESLFFWALCESGGHRSFPSPPGPCLHHHLPGFPRPFFSPPQVPGMCVILRPRADAPFQTLLPVPCLCVPLSFLSPSHNESLHLFPISSPGFHPLPPQPASPVYALLTHYSSRLFCAEAPCGLILLLYQTGACQGHKPPCRVSPAHGVAQNSTLSVAVICWVGSFYLTLELGKWLLTYTHGV